MGALLMSPPWSIFHKILGVIFLLVGCSPLTNGVGNGWNGGVTAVPAVEVFHGSKILDFGRNGVVPRQYFNKSLTWARWMDLAGMGL
jgi:hypothetical protein